MRPRDHPVKYPEVELIASQIGRPDDGTDPTGFYNVEFFVPLQPEPDWPAVHQADGWQRWFGQQACRGPRPS